MDNRKLLRTDSELVGPKKKLRQTSLEVFVIKTNTNTMELTGSDATGKSSKESTNEDIMEVSSFGSTEQLDSHKLEATGSSMQHSVEEKETSSDSDGEIRSEKRKKSSYQSTSVDCQDGLSSKTPQQQNLSLGTPINELKTTNNCAVTLSPLHHQSNRTVLFKVTTCFATYPDPWPDKYRDKWNDDYVKMPCSPNSTFCVSDTNGSTKIENRWVKIHAEFTESSIDSSLKLEKSILSYNKKHWNFLGLHDLFKECSAPETVEFFNEILPGIIRLALNLPNMCTQPIPLLKQNINHTIVLSQMQIASLLANAFLCTFPLRNYNREGSPYYSYPHINFFGLFAYYKKCRLQFVIEKLKCLINYFRRVTKQDPCGTVSFTRQSMTYFPIWKKCTEALCKLHITTTGTIEQCDGMLQMDFANKYLGGGVLNRGAVQEEILFATCPDLLASLVFTEHLLDHECMIIKGAERYNKSKGYAGTFRWNGDFIDQTPRDEWGRREMTVVALDATPFRGKKAKSEQYNVKYISREVNKAYCGFSSNSSPANLEAVATGNWGCGAFGGDARLKALLQIIAASKAGRDVVYFTFEDAKLCEDIHKMHSFLIKKSVTIGDLWKILEQYSTVQDKKIYLYEYIYRVLDAYDDDTE